VVVTTDALTPGVTYTVYVGRGFRGAPTGGTDSLAFTPHQRPALDVAVSVPPVGPMR